MSAFLLLLLKILSRRQLRFLNDWPNETTSKSDDRTRHGLVIPDLDFELDVMTKRWDWMS